MGGGGGPKGCKECYRLHGIFTQSTDIQIFKGNYKQKILGPHVTFSEMIQKLKNKQYLKYTRQISWSRYPLNSAASFPEEFASELGNQQLRFSELFLIMRWRRNMCLSSLLSPAACCLSMAESRATRCSSVARTKTISVF